MTKGIFQNKLNIVPIIYNQQKKIDPWNLLSQGKNVYIFVAVVLNWKAFDKA